LPVPAPGPPATRHRGCIATKIDAATAWQHDKSRKNPKMPIIFAIRRDDPALDHESGSDRKALR
jgi:hypothetical protein